MQNLPEKWRREDAALESERRAMSAALAALEKTRARIDTGRAPTRLIFELDLTASREVGLEQARVATAAMFETIRQIGRIAVKLAYYRGEKECKASAWHDNPAVLCSSMLKLSCRSGGTQIARLLSLALNEGESLAGVVFVGDHCEEKEEELISLARAYAKRRLPLYIFHECRDNDGPCRRAKGIFKAMAEASGGAYVEFRADSGDVLRELLSSIAAYSVGGADAVARIATPATAPARELRERLLLASGDLS